MKERLREMDYMRALAALSVIAIHITANYIQVNRIAYYTNQAVRYAVPLFIVISGMLLFQAGNKPIGIKGYMNFMNKRMKKILIPYVLWSLLYILYSLRHSLGTIASDFGGFILDTLHRLLFGTGYSHLYFMVIIIQLYFLYPLLWFCLTRNKWVTLGAAFFITALFQTGIYLHQLQVITLPSFVIPYYIFFPTWVFYFVFGMWFSQDRIRIINHLQGKTLLLGVMWLLSLLILLIDSRYTKTFASSMKPSVMLYSASSFLFFYDILFRFKDSRLFLWGFADYISRQSFSIYLSHSLIISSLLLIGGRIGMPALWYGISGMVFLYISTVAAACIFAWVAGLTPVAGLLGGGRTWLNLKISNSKTVSR